MIKIDDIYRATRGGLDVILHYYPQAAEVAGTKNKFRCRGSERIPSAVLLEQTRPDGMTVWKVCDFGDEGHALSPLDICMKEEGITRTYEAVLRLAQIFDVRDELNRSVNKPDIRQRPATVDEKDGTRIFALLPEIPAEHLEVLGPRVTREHAEALHWYEAEYVGYVKNRTVTLKYSTPHYPILMRECLVSPAMGDKPEVKFYKIYEPLNPDKGFRFSYTPDGVKPKDYINGLSELKEKYRTYNADREAQHRADPTKEKEAFYEEKLGEAFICSGERDALCCKSLGYVPIWFNSETYSLSEREYKEIMRYVKVLYNIPDIDATGRRKGRELALRYIDIHTVWLPDWLREKRDNRGKPCKDLRDWMQWRREIKDFRALTDLAMPVRFWTERENKKTQAKEYSIDAACLHYFLEMNGFYTLRDENTVAANYIRVDGNVVRRVRPKDIRKFVRDWAEERFLPRDIRNLILNSARLADSALENLREVELDFTNFTPRTQIFHFPRKTVEVTPDGIVEHGPGEFPHHVWEENVLPHRFELLPPMFEVTRLEDDAQGRPQFDIEVKGPVESCVWGYVINSSRLHWRKELEYRFDDPSGEEARAYATGPGRFRIDGEGLTAAEIREQKQNLLNKIFAIGYMLHRYKSPSRAWAPQAMDNKIGENGECNGRSGKSFLFKAMSLFMKTVKLSGRNPKLMDNPHVFDQVTRHTDFVLVDDCDQYLKMGQFYDIITSDLTVNPKNNQSYTLPFDDSPKFGFTTNYVPTDFDASTEARLLYMVYSDYYHQRTGDNDYRETRSIRDDFGRDLLTRTYPEADWNRDINFFLQCTRFYLSVCGENLKLLPPMDNIVRRKWKADMGENFEEWASVYFSEDGGHLDTVIPLSVAVEDFRKYLGSTNAHYTPKRFSRQLKAFCSYCPHIAELNPAEFRCADGRFIKKIDGKATTCIYLRSRRAAESDAAIRSGAAEGETFIPDEHSDDELAF